MSGRLPRFTPYGDFWASGDQEILVNDQSVVPLPGDSKAYGIAPVWLEASPIDLSKNRIIYTYNRNDPVTGQKHPLDGQMMTASYADGWQATPLPARGGDLLTAAGGKVCVKRGNDLAFFDNVFSGAPPVIWSGFVNPCYDDDGVLFACTMAPPVDVLHSGPTSALAIVTYPDGKSVTGARELSLRGGALAFQVGQRIFGRVSPDAPVEDLTLSGVDGEGRPIFVATPQGPWLLSHVTRGSKSRVILRPKGSTRGIVVADFDTDGPHDARYYAPTKSIRVRSSKLGVPIVGEYPLDSPLEEVLPPIVVPPKPKPNLPFVVDPNGVVEDILPWLLADPLVAVDPNGPRFFYAKSDEVSAEGRAIGEWRDWDAEFIGHLEDSSTGIRIYQGKRYRAEDWVALGEPVPWASLPLDRNYWSDGARLWLPRRCQTGWSRAYRTDITWISGFAQPGISVEIRVRVGRGVENGREVFVEGDYDPRSPDPANPKRKRGFLEINGYGPTEWVYHHFYQDDENGVPQRIN